ncbi:MAG: hypothetical protein MN733_16480 [Nitrososphaera sp.]|nr:hypothetical protein [Nitrososphaera sp.]
MNEKTLFVNVGNCVETPYSGEIEGAVVAIYSYAPGSHDGSGWALIYWDDGKWSVHNMSHCSCHDPWDSVRALSSTLDLDTAIKQLTRLSTDHHSGNHAMDIIKAIKTNE